MKDSAVRLELLERGQKDTTATLEKIERSIVDTQRTFVAELKSIREELATKASPYPIRAMIATGSSAGALVAGFLTIANYWLESKITPERKATDTVVARIAGDNDPALLKYRLDELQRRLRLVNPHF